MRKYILPYSGFILNESGPKYSHTITIGKVIPDADNPDKVIRVEGNTQDEFVIDLNRQLLQMGEALPDITMLKKIRRRLEELNRPHESSGPFPKSTMKDLKRKLFYYDGNFPFLLSVKRQLKEKGDLSTKQWEAVYRSFYGGKSPK